MWERTERRFHDAVEGEPLNPRRTLDLHLPRHQKRADFQVRCRLRLAPFSMACGPWRLKSVPSASKKSLFNDLRVASNDPPGFPQANGLHFIHRSATIAALTASPGEVTGG